MLEAIVIPKSLVVVDRVCTMTDYLPRHTVNLVNGILTKSVELLKDLPLEDLTRPTLQKTIIQNKGSMNVLPQDQAFVLSKLDELKRMFRSIQHWTSGSSSTNLDTRQRNPSICGK